VSAQGTHSGKPFPWTAGGRRFRNDSLILPSGPNSRSSWAVCTPKRLGGHRAQRRVARSRGPNELQHQRHVGPGTAPIVCRWPRGYGPRVPKGMAELHAGAVLSVGWLRGRLIPGLINTLLNARPRRRLDPARRSAFLQGSGWPARLAAVSGPGSRRSAGAGGRLKNEHSAPEAGNRWTAAAGR